KNGDGDSFDTVLRAFRLNGATATDLLPGTGRAVAADPVVNERSLTVSGGRVFFRTPEAAGTAQTTTRIATASSAPIVSPDGRWLAFSSDDSTLVPGDTNGWDDAFVLDRRTGQTVRVSVASDGSQASDGYSQVSDVTPDGRFVVFLSF